MKQLIVFFTLVLICCIGIPHSVQGETIELTTTLIVGSEPAFMIDEHNGVLTATGICPEIMNAFLRIAPEFSFKYKHGLELIPWARVREYLKDNIIQIQFGIARSSERETWYQYADTPLYPVIFCFAARKDDTEVHHISSFEDMKRLGGTVLGVRGANAVTVFQEKTKHLNIPVEVTPTNEQNLKKLIAGRGRYVVLYNHYALIYGAKKLGFQDKIVLLPLELKRANHWLAFSKAVPREVVQKADEALRKLQESGELKRICEKYGKLQ